MKKAIGSPPQVRGKLQYIQTNPCWSRITPAGAGKTDGDFADTLIARDHPRRCGENLYVAAARLCSPGSPPQVRGKLL